MRDRLTDLLEKADLAIASCTGVVGDDELAPLIETVRGVRTRLAYPEDVLVVALAGGTGSGKSSLFNALAGAELVDVGGVRPTTSHPEAALAESDRQGLAGYLDRLGIDQRHNAQLRGLCLLDLPDTDSVELDHRYRVDELLPLVDLVVWVTDPEKYRDARLHAEYLRPLADYSSQFLFVLNQADRLTESQAADVVSDLERALAEDGIPDPTVIATAAAPRAGPPAGTDDLLAALEKKREEGPVLYDKLLTDLAGTVARLVRGAGSPIEFDDRASQALQTATAALVDGNVARASETLTHFVDRLAAEVGGPTGEKVERLGGDIPQHVQRIADQSRPEATRGWLGRRGEAPPRDPEQVRSLLNETVIRPVRAVLAKRGLAQASIAELAVEVADLGSGSSR